MIFRPRPAATARQGAIAVLAACLSIPLLAMVAFAVDFGWIVHTQNELQAAADAAALAGAPYLADGWVQYYSPNQTTAKKTSALSTAKSNAQQAAIDFAGYNTAGAVKLSLPSSDVEFGFTDASYNYSSTYTGFPNTIKVTVRRDSNANTSLGLFFAPVLGVSSIDLTATAAATLQYGTVNGVGSLQTGSTSTLNSFEASSWILPMTYDVNHWNSFLAGTNSDAVTDSSGNPALNVYPSIKFTGNFGLLSLDQGNDGASTIRGWINSGVSNADLQNEYSAGLMPIPSTPPSSPNWKGNPGLKTSDIQAANGNVGQTYLLPLFQPVNAGTAPNYSDYQAGSGNGSHYYYTIVGFAGIKIVTAVNGGVTVEPAAVVDPNASYSSVTIATPPTSSSGSGGSSTSLQTTFAAPRLTQ